MLPVSLVRIPGVVVRVEKPVLEDELMPPGLDARAGNVVDERVDERFRITDVLAGDCAVHRSLEFPVPRRRVLAGKVEIHDVMKVEIRAWHARNERRLGRESSNEW